MLTVLYAILLSSFTASPSRATEDLADQVVQSGHRRIGVIPMVIMRRGEREATVSCIGPRGMTIANSVYEKLISASRDGRYRGQFQVIPERVMRAALRNRDIGDLSNPKELEALAQEVGGAGGFVLVSGTETETKLVSTGQASSNKPDPVKDKISGSIEVVDPNTASVTSNVKFEDELTLSKAAYQGQSWELRRWENGRLQNRAIELDGNGAFGIGSQWEREQYLHLKPGVTHPVSDPTFPFDVSVKVAGRERNPIPIGSQLVVELNSGEEYSIILKNNSQKDVFVALFIDGLSSINQKLLEPDKLPPQHHWFLAANSGSRAIPGWYSIERTNGQTSPQQKYSSFKVVESDKSVAAGQGFGTNIGMITAIFCTSGIEGIDVPDSMPYRSLGVSDVGTGEGSKGLTKLDFHSVPKQRGLILAACTLYYRSKQQIDNIRKGTAEVISFASADAAETKPDGTVNDGKADSETNDTVDNADNDGILIEIQE